MRDEPSRTAEVVCLFRAADQRRAPAERIVDDPYAKLFLGPVLRAALATIEATGRIGELAEEHAPGLMTYVVCRHRFIDDCLARGLDDSTAQVVLLGAGYDTRAYRFVDALGDRPFYELDFPATSRRKARVLERNARDLPDREVVRIEIDFAREHVDDVLIAAGFAPGLPTFFVWEGVSMYLKRAAVKDTLSRLHALGGPGTMLAMDYWFLVDEPDLVSTAYRAGANLLHLLGEPVTFSLHPEDAGPFMERTGFEVVDLADADELERRYVRDGRHVYPGNYVVAARKI
jgi:methyltransferase (TIGR00027 family)